MARGVEIDAERALGRRLVGMDAGAGCEQRRLGGSDVGDCEVEVELLRVGPAGPSGLDPVLYLLERKGGSSARVRLAESPARRREGDEVVIVRTGLHLPAEHRRVEAGECPRVRAVQHDEVELREG